MSEVPFVSIVIPTRNRVAKLKASLGALWLQDYPKERYDIVVVDDGSSDGTGEAIERISKEHRFPTVRCLQSEGHGANEARNTGIRAAEGDLVCFIDDDVLPPEQWLRTLVVAMLSHGVELSWGPVFLPPELELPGRHRWEVAPYLSESTRPEIPMLGNMLVRRAVFQRGLFDPRWPGPVEEVDWVLRVRPSRTFAADAWLWHNKSLEDCDITKLMRHAWRLGRVSGRFDRTRLKTGLGPLSHAVIGFLRSVGHAVKARCWGGVLVAAGRAGYAYGYGLTSLRSIRSFKHSGTLGSTTGSA